MYIAPNAELDDGLLDVVWIVDHPKWKYLRELPSVFKGKHVENEEVNVRRGRVVEIDADRPFEVYADGDPLAKLPATVTVSERALLLIAP
jgi:diacylglycerol kinase family enzyme